MTRRFLGIPEPVWRILLAGGVAALWMLVAWTATAYANDCAAYVQNPRNFAGNLQGLIEDCMRTGYVQAITTLLVGGVGGGGIVVAVNKALKGVEKDPKPAGNSGKAAGDHCGYCGAEMPAGSTKCPACSKEKATCRSCSRRFWSAEPNPLCPECFKSRPPDPDGPTKPNPYDPPPDPKEPIDHCGYCSAEIPKGAVTCPTCSKSKGTCRQCGTRFWTTDSNPLCANCFKTRPPEPDGPTKPNPYDTPQDPKDPIDHCGYCSAEIPKGAVTCPTCSKSKGTCRKCGRRFWTTDTDPVCGPCGMTPRAPDDGQTKPDPNDPKADPGDAKDPPKNHTCENCGAALTPGDVTCAACDEPTGEADPDDPEEPAEPKAPPAPKCPRCGADLPVGGTADGRCPTCGAKQPTGTTSTGTTTPITTGGSSSPPVTLTGDPGEPTIPVTLTQSAGGTPAAGATAPAGANPAGVTTPDPPFTQEGVISGDKAAELLEQAGLGKITRDENGKVTKVEEAFPGAFTNLGGSTVTIKGGETTGGGLGQDFVEVSKGKVTGIGVKPNGDLAIVVNHSEPKWEQRPATPAEIAAKFMQDAQAAAARASQAIADAAKSAEKAYNDIKKKLDQADMARAAYKITKFTYDAAKAEQEIRDLAKQHGVDPDELVSIVKLDNLVWDAIKAGVKLPDTLRGK